MLDSIRRFCGKSTSLKYVNHLKRALTENGTIFLKELINQFILTIARCYEVISAVKKYISYCTPPLYFIPALRQIDLYTMISNDLNPFLGKFLVLISSHFPTFPFFHSSVWCTLRSLW